MSAKIRRATIARECAVDSFSHFYLIRHQCPLFHCMKQVFCNHAETLASPMFFCFSLKVFFFIFLFLILCDFLRVFFLSPSASLSISSLIIQAFVHETPQTGFHLYHTIFWKNIGPSCLHPTTSQDLSLCCHLLIMSAVKFFTLFFFFNFFPELIISSILCLFLLVPLFFPGKWVSFPIQACRQ